MEILPKTPNYLITIYINVYIVLVPLKTRVYILSLNDFPPHLTGNGSEGRQKQLSNCKKKEKLESKHTFLICTNI